MDCGLLAHPKKLTPPQQVVKYTSFLLDTKGIPCMRIPLNKREWALAVVDHLLQSTEGKPFSRLSPAVAAGVLQSLAEATPRQLGNTYLRCFHLLVRPPGLGTSLEPYLTTTPISLVVRRIFCGGEPSYQRKVHNMPFLNTQESYAPCGEMEVAQSLEGPLSYQMENP